MTSADIVNRFGAEQHTIQQFAEYLERQLVVSDYRIQNACRILARYRLIGDDLFRGSRITSRALGELDRELVLSHLCAARPTIQEAIGGTTSALAALTAPAFRDGSYESELVDFFLDLMYDDESDDAQQAAIEYAHEEFTINAGEMALDEVERILGQMSDAFHYLLTERKANDLSDVLTLIDEVELTMRASEQDAEINTTRQAFILLMTAFDAAVFDLVSLALEKDFFRLIGWFGEKDKLALNALFDYTTFEELRESVIEKQLKGKYLRELLSILEAKGTSCIDVAAGDKYVDLLELVLRRNLHIHNRGRVDAVYLEKDDKGTPKYNIYNLGDGAMAGIDKAYLEKTNRLCKNCVEQVAAWVDSL